MRRHVAVIAVALAGCGAALAAQAPAASWDPGAAAKYLDARLAWWTTWKTSARDHDTFCISCHTALPYALARPALRAITHEATPAAPESALVANVTKRVRLWNEVEPFYKSSAKDSLKTPESRGTEAILNALVLLRRDEGSGALSADGRLALDALAGLQLTTGPARGAWDWLQFHNAPWEGDSQYLGATLAAVAIGAAPEATRREPAVARMTTALREYLARERATQPLLHQVMLVWASSAIGGLLTDADCSVILGTAFRKQQADGGIAASALEENWSRRDSTAQESQGDGYGTGLVTFVALRSGMAPSQRQVARSLAWLRTHQDAGEGRWLAWSLNKQRDLATDVGKFMSDAATAYAVLALREAEKPMGAVPR